MLLIFVSDAALDVLLLGVLTATSRMSLLPPFSVVKAFRMEGSCSVSNLTAMDVSVRYVDADASQWLDPSKVFGVRTVNDRTLLSTLASYQHH